MDRDLLALEKVLGNVGEKVARHGLLEARRAERSGLDRAKVWAPLLQRALAGGAPEEVSFRFAKEAVTLEVRQGGDLTGLAKALEGDGLSVAVVEGPPGRLVITRQ